MKTTQDSTVEFFLKEQVYWSAQKLETVFRNRAREHEILSAILKLNAKHQLIHERYVLCLLLFKHDLRIDRVCSASES